MFRISIFTSRLCRGFSMPYGALLEAFQEPYPRCPHESAPMGAGTIVGSGDKAGFAFRDAAAEASVASASGSVSGLVSCSTTLTSDKSHSVKSFGNRYLGLFEGSPDRHRFAPEWYQSAGDLSWQ